MEKVPQVGLWVARGVIGETLVAQAHASRETKGGIDVIFHVFIELR
jgi:hypothetical protein